MQMHLAADAPGQKRIGPAIFAIAYNRVANRRHMDTQLVGAPGKGLQFHPCGPVSGAVHHAIAGLGGLATSLIDMHFLAAGARLFGKRCFDHAFLHFGYANHQRPVNLLGRPSGKALGEKRRAARRARDQQNPAGVLVQAVDQARARLALVGKGIQQPINMVLHAGAALCRKAGRLVERNRCLVLRDQHGFCLSDFFVGQFDPFARAAILAFPAGRDAQDLACLQPVFRFRTLAIDTDLAGTRPAADHGKADLRQIALEPPVQTHAVIILAHGKLAH